MNNPVVSLITDFGHKDGFVGVMKGVIYKLTQSRNVIDLSHDICPHNIWEAAWVLNNSYESFPEHTIFTCVVDPGVGSKVQQPLLLYWPERSQYFIAPDNGLLTPILQAASNAQCYTISNADLFLSTTPSQTFHGRDIYAPTAAHLYNAIAEGKDTDFLKTVGESTTPNTTLPWGTAQQEQQTMTGQVMHIDHFGNLITNLPADWVGAGQEATVQLNKRTWVAPRLESYRDGESQKDIFLVPSSNGMLELTRYQQSTQHVLKTQPGDVLALSIDSP